MEKITMNDWQYHCHMLADIAKRNGAALMLYYDPHPHEDGSHQRNEYLEKWYKWLGLMGYSISDEEKAMLDGTHECFKEEK